MSETGSQTAPGAESDSDADTSPNAESAPTASTSGLFVPSNTKSQIWKYFKLKKDEKNELRAVCIKCPNKSLAYNKSTTTLWNHVQKVHFIAKPQKSKQPPLQTQPQSQSQDDQAPGPSSSTSSKPSTRQVSIEEAFKRYDALLIKTLF